MNFYDRFELLELLRDDGVKTFQAREIATGREVQAHLFVYPHAPLSLALLSRLEKLPASEKARILDRGKHEGTPYVVTLPLHDWAGFREWVSAKRPVDSSQPVRTQRPFEAPTPASIDKAGAWQVPGAPSHASPAPAQNGDSLDEKFASLFEIPAVQPPAPALTPEPAADPLTRTETFGVPQQPTVNPYAWGTPLPQNPPSSSGAAAPPPAGEFTRLFEAPKPADLRATQAPPARSPQQPAAPEPASPAPSSSAPPPGEFTRMFQIPKPETPAAPAPSVPEPAAPSAAPAGEFTRMFQVPKADTPAPAASSAPAVSSPEPAAPPAGEFTRMFQVPKAPATPAAPAPTPAPASAPPAGEFTRMFQLPKSGPPSTSPAAPAMPPGLGSTPTAPPSATQGPGEFTRMIRAVPPRQKSDPPTLLNPPGVQPAQGGEADLSSYYQAPVGPMPQNPIFQQPLKPQAPGSAGANKVGEFTQVFGRGDIPQTPPPPAPVTGATAPPNATQAFQTPAQGVPQYSGTPGVYPPAGGGYPTAGGYPPGAYPPAAGYPAAGAYSPQGYYNPYNPAAPYAPAPPVQDDFAQKFSAPAQLTLGQGGQNQPAAAPVAKPSSKRLPLILLGVGLVILVILLVVFFLTRPK